MAKISALWTRIASGDRLRRSSQAVSVLGGRAYVFGGELVPREPVDNQVDVVELKDPQGSNPDLRLLTYAVGILSD